MSARADKLAAFATLALHMRDSGMPDSFWGDVLELATQTNQLEAQVAELLPLVKDLAEFQSSDSEAGECAWCDVWATRPLAHEAGCPVTLAIAIQKRIDAGEFSSVTA